MNTLTPLAAARDALDGLTLYVPLGTSYPAVLEKCAEAIAAAPSITGAVAAGLRALDDAKCTWPPPSNRAPGAIELAAVAAHVRRHYADTAAADAFADGYYRAWDSRGHALPAPDEHADAWLAGQQMRPDYAAHVRAVEHADELLRAKFADTTTLKAQAYWERQYAAWRTSRASSSKRCASSGRAASMTP